MTQPQFSIVTRDEAPWTVVVVTGEVDMATAPELEEAIARADGPMAIDLSAVAFMDSSGLRTLINANVASNAETVGDDADTDMILVAPSAPVVRLLEVAGLESVFKIHDAVPAPGGTDADGS